ncbi:MAG TPA: RNA methyltransferase [Bacteroidales bacterium]|nr:RNA methyltransferase [Bacteroidales bacterium]HSA44879.1 RNA methyltransferase [Bacteroidales bacterium]
MKKLTNPELNRMDAGAFRKAEKLPVWIILDNIRSQHNIGSVFRSTDAFRAEGISLCGISAVPPHREIHRTALGAEDSVAWRYFQETVDAVKTLREQGYLVAAVEQAEGSVMLQHFVPEPGRKLALVFGNEIHGVDESVMDLVDLCIEIPQFGTKHSFNIAVSAGIILWEVTVKLGLFASETGEGKEKNQF